MKVIKRPHRSGSVRTVRNKPNSIKNIQEINAEPSMLLKAGEAEVQPKPHPLADTFGKYSGEVWEEYRAILAKLRQQAAENSRSQVRRLDITRRHL